MRAADRGYDARIRLHPAAVVAAPAGPDGVLESAEPALGSTRAVRSHSRRGSLPDGGFNIYRAGPSEISASVKAYFALKLAGIPIGRSAAWPRCASALWRWAESRRRTATQRSISACSISIRGRALPSIPPEILLLPGKLLYQMSSWTRAIVVSLAIVHAHDPQRPVPAGFNLEELFIPGKAPRFESDDSWLSWRKTFIQSDRILKFWEKYGFARIRQSGASANASTGCSSA